MKENICPFCHQKLFVRDQKYCASCGKYLKRDVYRGTVTLSPELIEVAETWSKGSTMFCIEVLNLNRRISHTLARSGRSPCEILALNLVDMAFIKNLGPKSFTALDEARKNWKK